MTSTRTESPDRFDHSFALHMIRDFFLILVVLVVIELGVRLAYVLYEFYHEDAERAHLSAERLAADVKSIMLNSGGPVAARTVYPIIKDNHSKLGLDIAIEPSEVTIASIESTFNFTPKGIPAHWPEGRFREVSVAIEAEEFCISCHVDARPGDVLGQVTVRSYLGERLTLWWHEVQLTGVFALGKIVLHSIILLFILKVRMEPLLSLRATVARLATGGADLSARAPINSHDEFGELARDLNLFLSRIGHVITDLEAVLDHIIVVDKRLGQVHEQMSNQLRKVDASLMASAERVWRGQTIDQFLSEEWLQGIADLIEVLRSQLIEDGQTESFIQRLNKTEEQVRQARAQATEIAERNAQSGEGLRTVSSELRELSHFYAEMAVLQEKMQAIANQGRTLAERLRGRGEGEGEPN